MLLVGLALDYLLLIALLDCEEENAVVGGHGHVVSIARDEIRVSHSEEVLVRKGYRRLGFALLHAFDVQIADVAGGRLLVEKEHVDVLAVIDCRNHQLWCTLFLLRLWVLSWLITVLRSQFIFANVESENRVWHD